MALKGLKGFLHIFFFGKKIGYDNRNQKFHNLYV